MGSLKGVNSCLSQNFIKAKFSRQGVKSSLVTLNNTFVLSAGADWKM